METGRCLSNGWSVIASAPTNSQLAGVLAGFLFTGVIILFGRSGSASTRTLGLFSSSFILLAFDSYLFSLISGSSSDPICQRIWTQSMPASGMLAVGGTALANGIGWLLANHAKDEKLARQNAGGSAASEVVNLQRLAQFMVLGVAAGVTLLMGLTTLDYLSVTFHGDVAIGLAIPIYTLPLVVAGVANALGRWRTSKWASPPGDSEDKLPARSLSWAIFSTLGYGVIGPLFAGAIANIDDQAFQEPSWILLTLSLSIGLIIPSAIIILLVYAIPRTVPTNSIKKFSHDETRSTPPEAVSGSDLPLDE